MSFLGPTVFGDTCPYLNISKQFGLDYGDVLAVADYLTHGRDLLLINVVGVTARLLSTDSYNQYMAAMTRQASRYRELCAGATPQHSEPIPA